jgi:hypothetical protein
MLVRGTKLPTDKLGLVIPWVLGGALILLIARSLALLNGKRGAQILWID